MWTSLKRGSGFTELDVVVRAYDKQKHVVDYARLDDNNEVVWVDGRWIGVGTTREAKIILKEIKRLDMQSLESIEQNKLMEKI